MNKRITKIKKRCNGSVRIIKSKKHSEKKLEKALHSITLPKDVSLDQLTHA